MDIEQTPDYIRSKTPETTFVEGILYHGTREPFAFSKDHNYHDPELNKSDGSLTLGEGLYLTNDDKTAENYSVVRGNTEKLPIVYSVYAPDCKFLDFRGENGGNVFVPNNMLQKWTKYFEFQFIQELRNKPDLGPAYIDVPVEGNSMISARRKMNLAYMMRDERRKYLEYLREISDKENIDLRVMLGTSPAAKNNTDFHGSYPAPPWVSEFRRFMIDEMEYDGIIYIEGGEGKDKRDHATYIVYDLSKIFFSTEPINKSVDAKGLEPLTPSV